MLKCLTRKDHIQTVFHTRTRKGFTPSTPLLSPNTLYKGERAQNKGGGFALRNMFCSSAISPYLQSKSRRDLFPLKTETKFSEKRDKVLVRESGENRLSRKKAGNNPSFFGKSLRSNKRFTLPKRREIGVICLCCTTGNTICTLLDSKGQTKGFATCGSLGFTNSRKRTSYASQAVAEKIGLLSKELGFTTNFLIVKGIGRGKGSAIRAFRKNGINILGIDERTSLPHNGCRGCRKRRK